MVNSSNYILSQRSEASLKARRKKEASKATRANHNRKSAAGRKARGGMLGGAPG